MSISGQSHSQAGKDLRRTLTALIGISAIILLSLMFWWWLRPPKPLTNLITLSIRGEPDKPLRHHREPFGIAVDDDGNIFYSESLSGRIYKLSAEAYKSGSNGPGEVVIAGGLDTPSAIAFDRDGHLIVANTGAHTIIRIEIANNRTSIIAGADGISGFTDGQAMNARFNGPIGLAVSDDGTVFVADTYNDRIRTISPDGNVSTIAGRDTGFADGNGNEAKFDTPCGIAVAEDGSMLIADTGNNRIRRVELNGSVTTIAGSGDAGEFDGSPLATSFDEPVAIAIRDEKSFYVADAAGSSIRLCTFDEQPSVRSVAGGALNGLSYGLADGQLANALINRPASIAIMPDGELAIADGGNGLIRALVPADSEIGHIADASSEILQAGEMRMLLEPRWPFFPPQNRRDISGTVGEIRGERIPGHDSWFHNGLDIAGAYGEPVHAILSEHVTRPISVTAAGGDRERLRLPLFEYIHLKIGRDSGDRPITGFSDGAITFYRDTEDRVVRVRIRRGTRVEAGQAIGTLNRLNHIHLVSGPNANEFNALAVLKLPGLTDTKAPVFESIRVTHPDFQTIFDSSLKQKSESKLLLPGIVRIIVRAYDQVDGNPTYRRLGLFRLGYQLIGSGGDPLPDFRDPRYTIVFDKLPRHWDAANLAYTEGSRSGYQGVTVFDYVVTNIVRGGNAREDFLDTSKLVPGNYRIRILAEDYFGNQSRREVPFQIE